MTEFLRPDPLNPGLFFPSDQMEPVGGNFAPGGMVEDPGNPGYFLFQSFDATTPRLAYLPPQGNGSFGPRVEVVVPVFPYEVANVWRITDGNRVLVRGGVARLTSGGLVVVDSEVPFGVPVTYMAGVDFEDGSSAHTPTATITLDQGVMGADYGKVFVHNVLEPSRSMEWIFTGDALGALTTSNPGASFTPEGVGLPMWMGGGESGLQGLDLSGSTYTLEDAKVFRGMFGTPQVQKLPILVFRGPPELLIPGTLFAVVPQRTPMPHNVANGLTEWVEWRMVGDEVQPPFPGLSEPVVTWEDVAVMYPTEAEYAAVYQDIEMDLARDYSLAGLSGN